ncbi:hypothetical protein [Sinorhizobium sp. Sb3]|jgi:hypothetical protein|uniref:hypothetical protein n=1 Tax=Sinorhizobium/Ensifer group TaxID=227292 RepID=UPI000726BBEB|nr:hypothetical protein [Sinorhizobium sp. Sb3]KSV70829.1 hypothetical protein N183_28755 [Sinorhizobium sp. Sb3]
MDELAHVFLLGESMAGQDARPRKEHPTSSVEQLSAGNVPLAAAHKSFVAAISLDTKLR